MKHTTHSLLLAAATVLASPAAQAAETGTMPVDGATLTYTEQGQGRPVVFVHGAISDARVWDGYADRIAEEGRFVAYAQRYFGTTDWPDDGAGFSRETHITDLIAFVEGLGAGPVDLVTWSYSGEIATYAALRRPDLFRSMVHFEPAINSALAGLPGADAAMAQSNATLGPAITALQSGDNEAAALRFIESVFRMPEGGADQEAEPFPTYWRKNGRTLPPFVSMAPGDPLPCTDLGRLTIPTLVVVGTDTLMEYALTADYLTLCSGNALQVRMAGATHDGPYLRPDRFTDLILTFRSLLTDEATPDTGEEDG